jgi:polysaccharide biosynthesis protein PslG
MGKMIRHLLTMGLTICLSGFIITCKSQVNDKFGPPNEICSGVNIHFTTGHEKDLDMIAAAGLKFIRMDFVWHDIERTKGIYDWSAYDELTSNLKKRGLRALYILDYSNPLYENVVDSKDPLTGESRRGIAAPCHTESVEAFARWAAAAATRYKGNGIIWELWNEPNITFWMPAPDVAQYLKLVFATCKAVRAADPGAVIIGPATSQVPLPFIESFLSSGIMQHIDAVSVHPYRDYSKPPETASEDYTKIRELIDRYSAGGKSKIPVISSEWGYASATKGISVSVQASFIVRMQLANLLYGIPLSIWYDWKNDGKDPGNFEHNCGTVTFDLEPKPAYEAVKTMNSELKDYALLKRIELNSDKDYVLVFRNKEGRFKLSAWTLGQPHTVNLEKIVAEAAKSTGCDWQGNPVIVKSENNKLILELSDMAQYITLPGGSEIN